MHIKKYKLNQLNSILKHYDREHISKNVNADLTKNNIYYFNKNMQHYFEVNNKKMTAHNIQTYTIQAIELATQKGIRKNANIMHDIIITQPKEYGNEYSKEFFDKVLKGLKEYEYNGKKIFSKCIMYAIHCDEKGQPHLHYSYVPLYEATQTRIKENKKRKTDRAYNHDTSSMRLNSDYFNKKFLDQLHPSFEKLTGLKLTNDNDNTPKNLSMKQYQAHQDNLRAYENLQRVIRETREYDEKAKAKKETQKKAELEAQKEAEASQNRIANFQNQIDNKVININANNEDYKLYYAEEFDFTKYKTELLNKDNVIIPKNDFEKIKNSYKYNLLNCATAKQAINLYNQERMAKENIENKYNNLEKNYKSENSLKMFYKNEADTTKSKYKQLETELKTEKESSTEFINNLATITKKYLIGEKICAVKGFDLNAEVEKELQKSNAKNNVKDTAIKTEKKIIKSNDYSR